MKSIGLRFHDGSEVIYYGMSRMQGGTDEFIRIVDLDNNVTAQVLIADVKEVIEAETEEQPA